MDEKFLPKLSQNLLEILNDVDEYYDVTIEVGNDPYVKIFRAHLIILSYRSSYLRRILSTNKKKNDGTLVQIKLSNISPKIFQIILRYIYGGRISVKEYENIDIIKILVSSNQLCLQELVVYLQTFLIENKASWMEQNFNLIYKISFENDSFLELQKYCTDLISKSSDKIFKSLNFPSIPEKLLTSLIQNDNLQMRETQLWEKVLKWGLSRNLNSKVPCKEILSEELYMDLLKIYLDADSKPGYKSLPCKTGEINITPQETTKYTSQDDDDSYLTLHGNDNCTTTQEIDNYALQENEENVNYALTENEANYVLLQENDTNVIYSLKENEENAIYTLHENDIFNYISQDNEENINYALTENEEKSALQEIEVDINCALREIEKNTSYTLQEKKMNVICALQENKENVNYALQENEEDINYALREIEEDIKCTLREIEENTSYKLQEKMMNVICALEENEENVNYALQENEENINYALCEIEEDINCALRKIEKNTSYTLREKKMNVICALQENEENVNYALQENEEDINYALREIEEGINCALRENEENINYVSQRNEENVSFALQIKEENVTCALRENEENVICALQENEENAICALRENEENINYTLQENEENDNYVLKNK